MTVFIEKKLQLTVSDGIPVRKFDCSDHGLSHCMKAVDFIIELRNKIYFIEFKDPFCVSGGTAERSDNIENYLTDKLDENLKYKYRDSFLYEWASDNAKKPIYYLVLLAIETLSDAALLSKTDDLNRKLPLYGPSSGKWIKQIVSGCSVFNISSWNRTFTSFPVSRIP